MESISNLKKKEQKFDLVFIDPPYSYFDEKTVFFSYNCVENANTDFRRSAKIGCLPDHPVNPPLISPDLARKGGGVYWL